MHGCDHHTAMPRGQMLLLQNNRHHLVNVHVKHNLVGIIIDNRKNICEVFVLDFPLLLAPPDTGAGYHISSQDKAQLNKKRNPDRN